MLRLISAALIAILFFYPIGVYFGLQYLAPRYIGLMLLILVLARWLLAMLHGKPAVDTDGERRTQRLNSLLPISLACAGLCVLVIVFNHATLIRINPVLINLILLMTFAYTLIKPPSMIERFARLLDPELPQTAIAYTRNVTKVWCVFFIINAVAAFYTCFYTSLEVWTLYNGLIAYALMGLLFLFEYLYRQVKIKKILES